MPSPEMIERAKENATQAGVPVRFETADFTRLDIFTEPFDAILCLGNSLPHLLSQEALVDAILQMRARLTFPGVLILHNLNYDLRMKAKPRFFSASGSADTLVWRFADYGPEFITSIRRCSSENLRRSREALHPGRWRSTARYSGRCWRRTWMRR